LTGLKRTDEAEALYRDVIDRWIGRSGEDHPSTLIQQNNYAMLLHDIGRYDDALGRLRRVGDALARRPNPTFEPAYRRNLGRVLLATGQLKAAEAELDTAYRLTSAAGNAAASAENARYLAKAFERQGRPDDAAHWRSVAGRLDASRPPTTRPDASRPATTRRA
jgi:tetratricopeptide (TPR) repeat protein